MRNRSDLVRNSAIGVLRTGERIGVSGIASTGYYAIDYSKTLLAVRFLEELRMENAVSDLPVANARVTFRKDRQVVTFSLDQDALYAPPPKGTISYVDFTDPDTGSTSRLEGTVDEVTIGYQVAQSVRLLIEVTLV